MEFLQRLYNLALKLLEQTQSLNRKLEEVKEEQRIEEYVDTAWITEHFGIASSTLSEYRKRGVIPYTYFAERGKYFYRKSEILGILDRNRQGGYAG